MFSGTERRDFRQFLMGVGFPQHLKGAFSQLGKTRLHREG